MSDGTADEKEKIITTVKEKKKKTTTVITAVGGLVLNICRQHRLFYSHATHHQSLSFFFLVKISIFLYCSFISQYKKKKDSCLFTHSPLHLRSGCYRLAAYSAAYKQCQSYRHEKPLRSHFIYYIIEAI